MGFYVGISLLRSVWHGAAIEFATSGVTREIRTDTETIPGSGIFDDLERTGIFLPLEKIGRLERMDLRRLSEHDVSLNAFNELRDTDLGACCNNFLFKLPQRVPDYVGISHPFGLSPVSRRALTALVDRSEPVLARNRTGRNAVVPSLKPGGGVSGLCALETPLAIALEQAASGKAALRKGLQCTFIVITPGTADTEITVIQMRQTAESLAMTVTDFCEVVDQDNCVPFRGTLFGNVEVLYLGMKASRLAGRIAQMNNNCGVREVAERDAALGVARYAALCGEGSLELPGGNISVMDCHVVAPYSIGICGRSNAEGVHDLFWCPLIEAGKPLSEKPVTIRLAEPPDGLILAECLSPARQPHHWVVGTQDLRLHSEVEVSGVRSGEGESQLEVTIQSSAGCLSYGWSDPFAAAVLRR